MGETKVAHRETQVRANSPYAIPNAKRPAKVCARTPHSTNVVVDTRIRVVRARSHGLIMSER